MAYKTLPPPEFRPGPLSAFYNVSMAVGPPGKPNNPDDVMLVQLCLQQIFANPTIFTPPPDGRKVVADGKCGPITRNAIWWFQTQVARSGAPIYPDGVIDKASDLHASTPTSHATYSILFLNLGLMRVIGSDRFAHLENDSITPYLLALRLAISSI